MHKTTTTKEKPNIYEILNKSEDSPELNKLAYSRPIPLENRLFLPESMSDGRPANTLPFEMLKCCDSRKDECPYAFEIEIHTPEVKYREYVCMYNCRRQDD